MLQTYLDRLRLTKKTPSLEYLNECIAAHQKEIPWENVTKIIDTTKQYSDHPSIPPIEIYIERLTKGMGGTCWTLAKGFSWLLESLEFDVHYLYMDSGHLCLRVDLDQPYYVDVGYCAPLFQAYPLFQSFTVKDHRERFEYSVTNKTIEIKRTPGPTKRLYPEPISIESMYPIINSSNDWTKSVVLKELKVFCYVQNVPVSVNGHVVKEYHDDQVICKTCSERELVDYIEENCGFDRILVEKAIEIFHKNKVD